MAYVSSCCSDDISEAGGHTICTGCGHRCDAIDEVELRQEGRGDYQGDCERQGD